VTSASDSGAYRGTRALVLGGSGFIGRWTARALARAGAEVHVGARDLARAHGALARVGVDAPVHAVDLLRDEEVRALLEAVDPAIVFDLAGYGVDPAQREEALAFDVNAAAAGRVAEALASRGRAPKRWAGRVLVRAGTALEYGPARGDLAEDTPCEPTTVYGRSKLEGTRHLVRIAARTGLPSATARLFTVYGPGEHAGRLLPALVLAARSGAELPLTSGSQRRDFAYVEDVAEGLLRLGSTSGPPGEIVNLATGRLTSVRDFAFAAARVLGIPEGKLRFGALPVRAEEMEHEPVRIERLRALCGWIPEADVENGIRRALGSGIGFTPG
jgi:UDP-glucose 4-epimerase